jgi:C-terminal processing protease CtpA/Prc
MKLNGKSWIRVILQSLLLLAFFAGTGCQKVLQPKQMEEDLDFLFKTIEEVHPNMYAYTPKDEFVPYRDDLYRQINQPISVVEFYKKTAPVVTLIKDGHTCARINNIILPWNDRFFPLLCRWQNQQLIIHRNTGNSDVPIGGVIVSVNGETTSKVMERISRYCPDETKHGNIRRAARDLGRLLRLEYGPTDEFTIAVRKEDGNIKEYVIGAVSFSKLREQITKSSRGKKYDYRLLDGCDAGILAINTFGGNMSKYKDFLKASFQKIKDQRINHLIIDIRNNSGGNSMQGEILLKYLTDKPFQQFERSDEKVSMQAGNLQRIIKVKSDEDIHIGSVVTWQDKLKKPGRNSLRFYGNKYILVGPGTFSSANCFTSAIECFKIGTIIGEETGGKTACFGHVYNFKLPNSKLSVGVSKKYFVEACGKPDGKGVMPDYEVLQKPQDTAKGVDTVLQFTLNLVKQSK